MALNLDDRMSHYLANFTVLIGEDGFARLMILNLLDIT